MTEWGEPIAVDGKRPEWLESDIDIPIKNAFGNWKGPVDYFDGDNVGWAWHNVTHIRLPANHPHYRTEATMVDWSKPIEVFYQGKWQPVDIVQYDPQGEINYRLAYAGMNEQWFYADGRHCSSDSKAIVRNVSPQAPEIPRTAPSQENGSGEAFERMKALVGAMAKHGEYRPDGIGYSVEARAIMALLAPADGDLVEAEKLAGELGYWPVGQIAEEAKSIALAAIKRGRQLERGGE